MFSITRTSPRILGSLAVAFATACGAGEPAEAPPAQSPTLTSAPVVGDNARIGQLETERDAVKRQLADVQNQATAEREQTDRRLRALSERIDFEDTAWARLDRIDDKVKALQSEMAKAKPARRAKLEGTIRDIAVKRETVEKNMHRTHSVAPEDWIAFTQSVDAGIEAIDRDLGAINDAR